MVVKLVKDATIRLLRRQQTHRLNVADIEANDAGSGNCERWIPNMVKI